MKTRKILFILAAICFVADMAVFHFKALSFSSFVDLSAYLWLTSLSVIFALAGYAIPDDQALPVNKWFRYTTLALTALFLLCFFVVLGDLSPYYVQYGRLMHRPYRLFEAIRCVALVWFVMLPFQKSIGTISPKLRNLFLIALGVFAFPVLLNIFDLFFWNVQTEESALYLYSGSIFSWLSLIIPVIVLVPYCWMLFDMRTFFRRLHRSSRTSGQSAYVCPPALKSAYPAIRIAVYVLLICGIIYQIFAGDEYLDIYENIVFVLFVLVWLLLSFMAFFQFPRSTFRLVYNALFIILIVGLLSVGIILPDYDIRAHGNHLLLLHSGINFIRMIRHRE